MDFSSRGAGQLRQQQSAHTNVNASVPVPAQTTGTGGGSHGSKRVIPGGPQWFRIVTVGLIVCFAVMAIAIAFSFYYNGKGESRYVNTNDYQAVFLNNGQVYFGRIKNLSDRFVDLQNIFYLSNQQSQPSQASTSKNSKTTTPNNFSLVKLGCELHGPNDEMVINKGQITFWENLRANGQVGQAINKWYQQNPNGLQCNNA